MGGRDGGEFVLCQRNVAYRNAGEKSKERDERRNRTIQGRSHFSTFPPLAKEAGL